MSTSENPSRRQQTCSRWQHNFHVPTCTPSPPPPPAARSHRQHESCNFHNSATSRGVVAAAPAAENGRVSDDEPGGFRESSARDALFIADTKCTFTIRLHTRRSAHNPYSTHSHVAPGTLFIWCTCTRTHRHACTYTRIVRASTQMHLFATYRQRHPIKHTHPVPPWCRARDALACTSSSLRSTHGAHM